MHGGRNFVRKSHHQSSSCHFTFAGDITQRENPLRQKPAWGKLVVNGNSTPVTWTVGSLSLCKVQWPWGVKPWHGAMELVSPFDHNTSLQTIYHTVQSTKHTSAFCISFLVSTFCWSQSMVAPMYSTTCTHSFKAHAILEQYGTKHLLVPVQSTVPAISVYSHVSRFTHYKGKRCMTHDLRTKEGVAEVFTSLHSQVEFNKGRMCCIETPHKPRPKLKQGVARTKFRIEFSFTAANKQKGVWNAGKLNALEAKTTCVEALRVGKCLSSTVQYRVWMLKPYFLCTDEVHDTCTSREKQSETALFGQVESPWLTTPNNWHSLSNSAFRCLPGGDCRTSTTEETRILSSFSSHNSTKHHSLTIRDQAGKMLTQHFVIHLGENCLLAHNIWSHTDAAHSKSHLEPGSVHCVRQWGKNQVLPILCQTCFSFQHWR